MGYGYISAGYIDQSLVHIVPFLVNKTWARTVPTSVDYRPRASRLDPPDYGDYRVSVDDVWARQLRVANHGVFTQRSIATVSFTLLDMHE
jgi:hypothetical protein